jgi:hypothetical protein
VNIAFFNQLGIKSNFDLRRLGDSVYTPYERSQNQVRIKLSGSVAERFINEYDSTNAYASDSAFRSKFAGFAVVPDAGGNALVRVNLLDSNTKLALYYKFKNETTGKDTFAVTNFRFVPNAGSQTSGNANRIRRDYSGTEIQRHLVDAKFNDSLLYIQTSPGLIAKIRVPGLSTFSNALIHRAELEAIENPESLVTVTKFAPPRYLFLSADDTSNKVRINIPNDYTVDATGATNLSSFGGFLSYRTQGTTRLATYNFNLTRYVQGIISRKEANYTLRLSAPSNDSIRYRDPYPATIFNTYYVVPNSANNVAVGRVRLGGGFGTVNRPYRMRLRIIYSKL